MFERLYIFFGECFIKRKEEGKDEYSLIKHYVPFKLLNELYLKFVKDGIPAIENLEQNRKQKYFDIACKYYETINDRIKASRAAYVLELITSTE